ncbi:MAG: TIGR01212 family radical SAM protein [Bacteroides sp.]|nr:TIGR01212 family radical SAM protein [Bacteroides sp.]MCM1389504.1 TIGR01212 family radical SAM protein [Bacteroides sp.]
MYRDFSTFLKEYFPGKVQKISINAGFSCPNRDGTIGTGGCTYCNNQTFNPGYCKPDKSVTEQLEEGKAFFGRKYPEMQYLAYFQAYTSTHGELERLKQLYEEALSVENVVGIIIGTRPDCMDDELLDYLAGLNERAFVLIEYGAESSHNETLKLINRCHTWEQTVDAVMRTTSRGLLTGLHLIMGLPGESREMMLATVDAVSKLPVATVKFHQLQLVRGTVMAHDVLTGKYDIPRFSVDEYIELCVEIIKRINPEIAIERFTSQSPDNLLIYPKWGLKNHEFVNRLRNALNSF